MLSWGQEVFRVSGGPNSALPVSAFHSACWLATALCLSPLLSWQVRREHRADWLYILSRCGLRALLMCDFCRARPQHLCVKCFQRDIPPWPPPPQ